MGQAKGIEQLAKEVETGASRHRAKSGGSSSGFNVQFFFKRQDHLVFSNLQLSGFFFKWYLLIICHLVVRTDFDEGLEGRD